MKLLILLAMLASSNAYAGNLDIDYIKPSPTKAFAASLVLPGAGFFYLNDSSPYDKYEHELKGYLYFGVTALAFLYSIDQIKKDHKMQSSLGIAGMICIRIFEFGDVIESAENNRFKAYKELNK